MQLCWEEVGGEEEEISMSVYMYMYVFVYVCVRKYVCQCVYVKMFKSQVESPHS